MLYALIYIYIFSAYRKSSYISSQIFANQLILLAIQYIVLKLRIKNCLREYLEFFIINIKAIITRLITLIFLLYSYFLDVGLIVSIVNYNFFITSIFQRSYLFNYILSYRLSILLILFLTILIIQSYSYYSSRVVFRKIYQHL